MSEHSLGHGGPTRLRFANDSDLTFIAWDPESCEHTYQREARVHIAQRRKSQNKNTTSAGRVQNPSSQPVQASPWLLDPLSSFARDPFHRGFTQSSTSIEQTWHCVFPQYFGLPSRVNSPQFFPSPSKAFLAVAKAHDDLYRSIVLQIVVTANVKAGIAQGDVLFQNQAFILRDFRNTASTYGVSTDRLSSIQFHHVFASAFSFSTEGSGKEAGYNAIVRMNSLVMNAKQHANVTQTPISEWFRMLMPRPGPSFHRSRDFQREMLRKINLTFDFLDKIQNDLNRQYPKHVSKYLIASSALARLVMTQIPEPVSIEPYLGFYTICRHRALSLLLRHLDNIAQQNPLGARGILQRFEDLAAMCLQYPSPQSVALFLWYQISTAEAMGLTQDQDEQFFSWSMKDLLIVHRIKFADEMATWIAWKGQMSDITQIQSVDTNIVREKMRLYYNPDARME